MGKFLKRLSGWRTSLLLLGGVGVGSTETVGGLARDGLAAVAGVLTAPGAEMAGTAALVVMIYQAWKVWSGNK